MISLQNITLWELNEDILIENQIIFNNARLSVVRPTYDEDVAYKSSICCSFSVKSTEQLLSFLWGLFLDQLILRTWSIKGGSCISCIFTCQNAKRSSQWSQFRSKREIVRNKALCQDLLAYFRELVVFILSILLNQIFSPGNEVVK